MSARRWVSLVGLSLVGGCGGEAAPSDGGLDAVMIDAVVADDAPASQSDAHEDDAFRPVDAYLEPDVGPDLGALGCSMPGMAMRVAMPASGEAWTAVLDPSMRAHFHTAHCAPRARTPDVVLQLVPGISGRLVIETTDPAIDTIVAVRTRCDDDTSEVACNDDARLAAGPSRVALDVTAGTPLFVIVDARGTPRPIPIRATVLPLRARTESCDPTGLLDACAVDTTCIGEPARCRASSESGCPPTGAFVNLDPLLDGRRARYAGTLVGAPDGLRPMRCGSVGAAPDRVHRLTMPFRAKVDAIAYGRTANLLYVRRACSDPASEVSCDVWGGLEGDASPIFEAGEEVFFIVEPRPGATPEAYEMVVDLVRIAADGEPCALVGIDNDHCAPTSICRDEGGPARICRPIVCGDGFIEADEQCDDGRDIEGDGCSATCTHDDTCAMPIELQAVGEPDGAAVVFHGSTRGAADRHMVSSRCSTTRGGPDVFFHYVAPRAGTLRVSTETTQATLDTIVDVRTGCPGMSLACNDDVMTGVLASVVNTRVSEGQSVIIVVDTFHMNGGPFDLRVEVLP